MATYTCDPGYAVVGQRTRTCEDTNGGTVTMGNWSGAQPSCNGETYCSLLQLCIMLFSWELDLYNCIPQTSTRSFMFSLHVLPSQTITIFLYAFIRNILLGASHTSEWRCGIE